MTYEKKYPFTKVVIEELEKTMVKQDEKGMEKYGQALDPMDTKYNWLQMAEEELADLSKYFKAEQHKRDTIIQIVLEHVKNIERHAKLMKDSYTESELKKIRINLGKLIPGLNI